MLLDVGFGFGLTVGLAVAFVGLAVGLTVDLAVGLTVDPVAALDVILLLTDVSADFVYLPLSEATVKVSSTVLSIIVSWVDSDFVHQ